MDETFVVIGGDAAGMSAASKAKRDEPDLDVIVFEKGKWVSYGACGLPYYIKGEINRSTNSSRSRPRSFARSAISISGRATRSSGSIPTIERSPLEARTARRSSRTTTC